MDWTEITATVPVDKTDEAAAIANMTVPYGIYIEDYTNLEADAQEIAHIDLIDEELVSKDRTHSIIHMYIAESDNAVEAVSYCANALMYAELKMKSTAFKLMMQIGTKIGKSISKPLK